MMKTRTVKIDPEEVDRESEKIYQEARSRTDPDKRITAEYQARVVTEEALVRAKESGKPYKQCLDEIVEESKKRPIEESRKASSKTIFSVIAALFTAACIACVTFFISAVLLAILTENPIAVLIISGCLSLYVFCKSFGFIGDIHS